MEVLPLPPPTSSQEPSGSAFYELLNHAHSGWRWLVLLLVAAAIANALLKWQNLKHQNPEAQGWAKSDKLISLFALISAHVQLLLGLMLYFLSPQVQLALNNFGGAMKEPQLRYFSLEHPLVMILGLVAITLGYAKAKRQADPILALKNVWLWYGIGLVLILSRVPWPGQFGTGWF